MGLVGKVAGTVVVASAIDWVVADVTVASLCVLPEAALCLSSVLATDW